MPLIKFSAGDVLVMKKKHPCGSDKFTVIRSGSDVRIACVGCKRDLTLQRETLEKAIKSVIPKETNERNG
ncbi:MAG: DUF951 domain-containing protein [Clostridia bacterium]|nr:DUF951 domain-containing protein [Clostridia bacterium]